MSCVLDCANKWLAPAALGCTRAVDVVSRGMDRDIFGRKLSGRISGTVVAMAPTVPSLSFFFFFKERTCRASLLSVGCKLRLFMTHYA